MKRLIVALAVLFSLGSFTPVLALPGYQLHKNWTGVGHHPFYIQDYWTGSCFASWTAKSLPQQQRLVWNINFPDEMHPVSEFESFTVVKGSCQKVEGDFDFFTLNVRTDINTGLGPDCLPQAYFSPASPDNLQLRYFIQQTYREDAPTLLADLAAAHLVISGRRYFRVDEHFRHKLSGNGIPFYGWRGRLYDYLISPIGFAVTYRRSGYFSTMLTYMQDDLALLHRLNQNK